MGIDRFSPDDLHKKGFVPDGKGGWKPGGKRQEERRPTDISKELGIERKVEFKSHIFPVKDTMILTGTGMPGPEEMIRTFNEHGFLLVEPAGETFILPSGEVVKIKYRLDIDPKPAPRMVRSDKGLQRPIVRRYFAWRDAFRILAAEAGFTLDWRLHAIFIFEMPKYWNKKKKADRLGQLHQQRPDWDNCCKSICDAFGVDDGFVADGRGIKLWGEKSQILILA